MIDRPFRLVGQLELHELKCQMMTIKVMNEFFWLVSGERVVIKRALGLELGGCSQMEKLYLRKLELVARSREHVINSKATTLFGGVL